MLQKFWEKHGNNWKRVSVHISWVTNIYLSLKSHCSLNLYLTIWYWLHWGFNGNVVLSWTIFWPRLSQIASIFIFCLSFEHDLWPWVFYTRWSFFYSVLQNCESCELWFVYFLTVSRNLEHTWAYRIFSGRYKTPTQAFAYLEFLIHGTYVHWLAAADKSGYSQERRFFQNSG